MAAVDEDRLGHQIELVVEWLELSPDGHNEGRVRVLEGVVCRWRMLDIWESLAHVLGCDRIIKRRLRRRIP